MSEFVFRCTCDHGIYQHGEWGCRHKNRKDVYCDCSATPHIMVENKRLDCVDYVKLHRCYTHPRYQAKRQPRCACDPCWRLWILLHPRRK